MVALYLLDRLQQQTARQASPLPDTHPHYSSLNPPPDPLRLLGDSPVLFASTRPALLPYADPLVALASRLAFLPYHVLVPHAAARDVLRIPMAERVSFRTVSSSSSYRRSPSPPAVSSLFPDTSSAPIVLPVSPSTLLLELRAGQDLQVYDVSVALTARLSGLRWLMGRYRAVAFAAGTGAFWACELLFAGAAWLVWWYGASARRNSDDERTRMMEEEEDVDEQEKMAGALPAGIKREEEEGGRDDLAGLKRELKAIAEKIKRSKRGKGKGKEPMGLPPPSPPSGTNEDVHIKREDEDEDEEEGVSLDDYDDGVLEAGDVDANVAAAIHLIDKLAAISETSEGETDANDEENEGEGTPGPVGRGGHWYVSGALREEDDADDADGETPPTPGAEGSGGGGDKGTGTSFSAGSGDGLRRRT
ncbi:hypothetical protein VTK73DRAFT_1180 [Phialemonium thermophilum]|uniref:Uncharacterized protein n=1 Tax=Phialemonium thermophilum TaxID=223376 RepID=A0ABR3VTR8_9PEZI